MSKHRDPCFVARPPFDLLPDDVPDATQVHVAELVELLVFRHQMLGALELETFGYDDDRKEPAPRVPLLENLADFF